MARHRRFSFEFKRQLVLDVLEERVGLRGMACKHFISRSLIRQWIQKCETGQLTDELDEIRIAEYEGKIAELERKRPAGFSVARGCRTMKLARSTYYYYRSRGHDNQLFPVSTSETNREVE